MIYFLIGYPGSGKSYFGKELANILKYDYIDLDSYIENVTDKTISNIINESGEPYFRDIESLHLARIIKNHQNDLVISCGGGTPCYHNNILLMKNNGIVIWIKTPLYKIFWRLFKDNTRPLTKNKFKLLFTLLKLKRTREKIYKKSDMTIDFNKNWNRLSKEEKEKIVNSYFGIESDKIREDIDELLGKENIYNYREYLNCLRKSNGNKR